MGRQGIDSYRLAMIKMPRAAVCSCQCVNSTGWQELSLLHDSGVIAAACKDTSTSIQDSTQVHGEREWQNIVHQATGQATRWRGVYVFVSEVTFEQFLQRKQLVNVVGSQNFVQEYFSSLLGGRNHFRAESHLRCGKGLVKVLKGIVLSIIVFLQNKIYYWRKMRQSLWKLCDIITRHYLSWNVQLLHIGALNWNLEKKTGGNSSWECGTAHWSY